MSIKYKAGNQVPDEALCVRLEELTDAVTKGRTNQEFTMRVPAEVDRDADLVLAEAARRIRFLKACLDEVVPPPTEEFQALLATIPTNKL